MRDRDKPDIATRGDLRRLVHRFYALVRTDAELGPIFASRLRDDDWPEHLDTMTRFWSSIVLVSGEYHGGIVFAHAGLPIESRHFARWLELWRSATTELFAGPEARAVIRRAERIAAVLERRLEEEIV